MNDTDRKLMLLICEDPRMPIQEVAKRLGISRQTANHRIKILTKMGVFKDIKAAISFQYLGAIPVYVWGRTIGTSIEKILDRFGENELTDSVIVLGGNNLHVVGAPRSASEVESYLEFVKRAAEMPEPTLGIPFYGNGINPPSYDKGRQKQSYEELSPLDLRIIASLSDDARKPTSEIADGVGVSARTVRRRLERMESEGLLTFDMPWDIPSGEEMFTLIHLNLRRGSDKAEVARRLRSKYPLRLTVVRSFTNLPDFLIGLLKSDKMREIRKILKEIGEDKDVLAVTPNLIYLEREYWCWDRKLPVTMTRFPLRTTKHDMRSGLKKR